MLVKARCYLKPSLVLRIVLLEMICLFPVLPQTVLGPGVLSTEIAGLSQPSDMVFLNVSHDVVNVPFLSTHFAHCSIQQSGSCSLSRAF